MTAELLHPNFARPPGVEIEGQLIGGVLALSAVMPNGTVQALGLTGEEFSIELFRKVWKHVRAELDQGFRPTHQTVSARGAAKKQVTPKDSEDLARLAETNTLTLEAFKLVAAQFKNLVVGLRTAGQLEQVAQRIRSRGLDSARDAGALSGIERELRKDGVQLQKLTYAQDRLLRHWDANVATGQSDLIPTGIQPLDDVIGGLPKRVVCLFAADPGVGKTAFVNSMFHSMLLRNAGLTAGIVGIEDGVGHVPERLIARRTGWLLREVGSKELKGDEADQLTKAAADDYDVLDRIWSWEGRGIDSDELLSVLWRMASRGVGFVGIDNFNKIRIKGVYGEQPFERTLRFSEQLSEVAEKADLCVGLIIHNSAGGGRPGEKRGIQGGEALNRDARFRIDFTDKGDQLRGTIVKANKLCRPGTVIAFKRQATAGLIDPHEGGTVNVAEEARIEREAKEDAAFKRQFAHSEKRKAKLAELKAAAEAAKPKPVEPEAQATLIDVPAGEKP